MGRAWLRAEAQRRGMSAQESGDALMFHMLPMTNFSRARSMQPLAPSMLSTIDWRRVSRIAQREQRNRERHAPVVSAYRWWARRPHSVMGAILDAAAEIYGKRFTVADPFSGGGTVTFEATRRGLSVYAQDLYPWAAEGLATALTPADPKELRRAASHLLIALEPHRAQYRSIDGSELTHILRVRIGCCPHCQEDMHLFPEYMVTLASRSVDEKRAYYGCSSCGEVTLAKIDVKSFHCHDCGQRHDTSHPVNRCSRCKTEIEVMRALGGPLRWKAVLVQRVVMEGKQARARLRLVLPGDPVDEPNASASPSVLVALIRTGIETKRLLRLGYSRWSDLYTARQAAVLLDALAIIRTLPYSETVKDRLAFSVIGCAEMPAYLSRWDRSVLKPFEALANHRYAHTTLAVEMNPLASVGRGTLAKRLTSACKSLQWLSDNCGQLPNVRRVLASSAPVAPGEREVVVATGSSAQQAIPDDSVQLVLSDPPYLDDVQYGELSRLFHVWLSAYKPITQADEHAEAVPNRSRGTNVEFYERVIASCLAESRRTLARRGRMVLTFHNTKLVAWQALAGALHRSGFEVRALAVVHAENGTDLCKRNVNSMLHDLVLECGPCRKEKHEVHVPLNPKSAPEKNLVAVGLALAASARTGNDRGLPELYRMELKRLDVRRVLIE